MFIIIGPERSPMAKSGTIRVWWNNRLLNVDASIGKVLWVKVANRLHLAPMQVWWGVDPGMTMWWETVRRAPKWSGEELQRLNVEDTVIYSRRPVIWSQRFMGGEALYTIVWKHTFYLRPVIQHLWFYPGQNYVFLNGYLGTSGSTHAGVWTRKFA